MTAPSNANTSGLEVVDLNGLLHQAWERLHRSDADVPGALVVLNALHVALEAPLVTAASAQARIAELEARNLDLSMLAYGWMEAHDLLASGKPYLFPSPADVPESIARATAAEARADRLAKALKYARYHVVGSLHSDRQQALDQIDAALQQETQK